ncbi:MAG: hypothetical protein AAF740_07010 [Bacteroidota bacterium]
MRYLKVLALVIFLGVSSSISAQVVEEFSISSCLKDCVSDSSDVINQEEQNGLTSIHVRTFGNCNSDVEASVVLKDKVLDLRFDIKSKSLIREGEVIEIIEVADCNCLFLLDYKVRNLSLSDFDRLLVNGKTLQEIDTENRMEEIKVDLGYE